jgi:hypothetical protein
MTLRAAIRDAARSHHRIRMHTGQRHRPVATPARRAGQAREREGVRRVRGAHQYGRFPLLPEEEHSLQEENRSCRSSYLWKNGLTWTGSIFVAVAAELTVGGAYATGLNDTTGKILFGVSAGSLAALGSGLVAVGGILAGLRRSWMLGAVTPRSSGQGCTTRGVDERLSRDPLAIHDAPQCELRRSRSRSVIFC